VILANPKASNTTRLPKRRMPAARLMNRVAHRRREKDGWLYSDKECAGLPGLTELATSAHGRC
jgi:hypothetical protein